MAQQAERKATRDPIDPNSTQKCKGPCQEVKLVDQFGLTPSGGLRQECKDCKKLKDASARQAAPQVDRNSVPMPVACKNCGLSYPDVSFAWRSDIMSGGWRPECHVCTYAMGYSQAYRAHQLEKDAVAFRARNRAVHEAWKKRNPKKMAAYKRKYLANPRCQINNLISRLKREYETDDVAELPLDWDHLDALEAMLTEACHYCGRVPQQGQRVNGLDRVVPGGLYSIDNAVPCCNACNFMKLAFSVDEFLTGVDAITHHLSLTEHKPETPVPVFGGTQDRREAPPKAKDDNLPLGAKIALWSNPCYLCGRGPALGIDRVDAAEDYTIDNCQSCCSQCNYMKKDFHLDVFTGHVARIFQHTAQWVLGDVSSILTANNGTQREPYGIVDESGMPLLVFPSSSAARKLTCKQKGLTFASNHLQQGIKWAPQPVRVYRAQTVSPAECADILRLLCQA